MGLLHWEHVSSHGWTFASQSLRAKTPDSAKVLVGQAHKKCITTETCAEGSSAPPTCFRTHTCAVAAGGARWAGLRARSTCRLQQSSRKLSHNSNFNMVVGVSFINQTLRGEEARLVPQAKLETDS